MNGFSNLTMSFVSMSFGSRLTHTRSMRACRDTFFDGLYLPEISPSRNAVSHPLSVVGIVYDWRPPASFNFVPLTTEASSSCCSSAAVKIPQRWTSKS